jgi:small conductance mechanosensitive channel
VFLLNDFFTFLQETHIGKLSLSQILSGLIFFGICVLLMKIVVRIVDRALAKSKLEKGLVSFIRSISRIGLWALVILVTADKFGVPITTFVAVLSVAGLALSLSVQNILSNLFSGFTILATKPFLAGDYVELDGTAGTVHEIGLFHTSVNTVDNKHIFIPNSDITSSRIINYTTETDRRVDIRFTMPYEYDPEAVKKAALEATVNETRALPDPAPEVCIDSFGTGGVNYILRLWVHNSDYWPVYYDMNDMVSKKLREYGLSMSYTGQNIRIIQDKQ